MPKLTKTQKQEYEKKIAELEGQLNLSEQAVQEERMDICKLRACILQAEVLNWMIDRDKGWRFASAWYSESRQLLAEGK